MDQIGIKISEVRKRKGLTQEELSESANINLRTLQRVENGETAPRKNTLRSLCEALEIDIEKMFDLELKEDNGLLAFFHLSVISFFFIPLGNIIIPLII